MTDQNDPNTIAVALEARTIDALDDWIARSIDPSMDRGEAVRHVLVAALGHATPSTMIPGLITGRDIV